MSKLDYCDTAAGQLNKREGVGFAFPKQKRISMGRTLFYAACLAAVILAVWSDNAPIQNGARKAGTVAETGLTKLGTWMMKK